MLTNKIPKGWVITTIDLVAAKCDQRKPNDNEQFIYVDISSIDRVSKKILEPQALIGKEAPSRARKVISKGDVIVSLTRPNLNAVALIDDRFDGQIASTGFEVLKPILIESKYLFAIVRSTVFINTISGKVKGALYPAAKAADIRNFTIPLPPLAEQKQISIKLDKLLARVDILKYRLDSIPVMLERLRQSFLATTMRGKLTEKRRRTHSNEQPETVIFEELLLDKSKLSYGVLKPGDEDPNGVPMIRIMDLTKLGTISGTNIFRISEDLSTNYQRTIVSKGDIVLSVMGTVGRVAIIPEHLEGANVNRALAVIKLNDRVSSEFLLYQIMGPKFQNEFVNKKIGSAQKRINLSDLRKFEVWLPARQEQEEIVRSVNQMFMLINRIENCVKSAQFHTNNLTQSILTMAFQGDLTAEWRSQHPELISGNNSAEALREEIKTLHAKIKRQKISAQRNTQKKMRTKTMKQKQIIPIVEALKSVKNPLTSQQLLSEAGYPSNATVDQLESFFLDIREQINIGVVTRERQGDNELISLVDEGII